MSETKCLECNINTINIKCIECEYLLCTDCHIHIHTKEKINNHNFFLICDECEDKERKFHCNICGQKLCSDCDILFHKKGNRAKHSRDYIDKVDKYNILLNILVIDYRFIESKKNNEQSYFSDIKKENTIYSVDLNQTTIEKNNKKFQFVLKQKINLIKTNSLILDSTIIIFPNKTIMKKNRFLKKIKDIKFFYFENYNNPIEFKEYLNENFGIEYNWKNLEIYSNLYNSDINIEEFKKIFKNSKFLYKNWLKEKINNYSFLINNLEKNEIMSNLKELKIQFLNLNYEKNKTIFNISNNNIFDKQNFIFKLFKELEFIILCMYNKGKLKIQYIDIINKLNKKNLAKTEIIEMLIERLIEHKFLRISEKQVKEKEFVKYIFWAPNNLNYEIIYWIFISFIKDSIKPTFTNIQNRLREFFEIKIDIKNLEEFIKNYNKVFENIKVPNEILEKEINRFKEIKIKIKGVDSSKHINIWVNNTFIKFDDEIILDKLNENYKFYIGYINKLYKEDLIIFNGNLNKSKSKFLETSLNEKEIKGFKGGYYAISSYILNRGPDILKQLSLGYILNLTKKAVDDGILIHHKNFILKKDHTEKNLRDKSNIFSNKNNILNLVKKNLIEILDINQGKFPLSNIKEELEKRMDIKIDLNELGFPKLKSLIKTFKDIIDLKICSNNQYFIHLKSKISNRKSKKERSNTNKYFSMLSIKKKSFLSNSNYIINNNKVIKNINLIIWKIMENNKSGIEVNNLKTELNKNKTFKLLFKNLNYENFLDFLLENSNNYIDFEIKNNNNNWILVICYPKNTRFAVNKGSIKQNDISKEIIDELKEKSHIKILDSKIFSTQQKQFKTINNINISKIYKNNKNISINEDPRSIISNNKIIIDDFSKNLSKDYDLNLSTETFLSHGSSIKNLKFFLNNSSNSLLKQFQGGNINQNNDNKINENINEEK